MLCRNLPSNVKVMSWNSKVISKRGKYLGLSNMNHNDDLKGQTKLSFSFVMLGTTIRQMAGYTGKKYKSNRTFYFPVLPITLLN